MDYNTTENKWGIGAKLWFGLMIASQWLMYINEITKQYSAGNAKAVYFVVGAIGTALYLWLALSKKKAALYTLITIAAINVLVTLCQGGGASAFLGMIAPGITYLIAHNKTE